MAYSLQAFIGSVAEIARIQVDAPQVPLSQGLALLPITSSVREKYSITRSPLVAEDGVDQPELPHVIQALGAQSTTIAYVEAEFFGGDGMQAAAAWESGSLVFGPLVAEDAINQVLRFRGIMTKGYLDEFAALDLGRHRDTDEWI